MAVRGARRLVAALARTALALAVVGGLALAGTWWPRGEPAPADALEVEISAGRAELVCPGPPRLQSDGTSLDFDRQFDPSPQGTTTIVQAFSVGRGEGVAAAGGYADGLDRDLAPSARLLPAGEQGAGLRADSPQRSGLLAAAPPEGGVGLVAGALLARTEAGDLRGLVGSRCFEPAPSAWLFAGSTEVGTSARLVLANPGETAATVALEAWGRLGAVGLGQAASVVVPAGGERAVLLEAFAPDEPRLALRLTVDGGEVAATVQDSSLDGFVPAGVDLSAPAVEPATQVVVPAVVLPETDIDTADASRLRVLNPGTEPAEVRLRLLHAEGEVEIPGAQTLVVDPGTVFDVSLAGVPAGAYAAELVADHPVTAAAVLTRVGEVSADDPDTRLVDLAWVPAVTPTSATSLVALPGLGTSVDSASVVVSNPGEEPIDLEVRTVRSRGRVSGPEPLTVPARSSAVLDGGSLAGAVGVVIDLPGGAQEGAGRPGFVAAAVLEAQVADGPLITAIGSQADLEVARAVAVRLPYR